MGLGLGQFRFLIRDHATVFVNGFNAIFASEAIEVIQTPPGAPRANAIAERFVRTVRAELLNRTLIWNQAQIRQLLEEYLERPHR